MVSYHDIKMTFNNPIFLVLFFGSKDLLWWHLMNVIWIQFVGSCDQYKHVLLFLPVGGTAKGRNNKVHNFGGAFNPVETILVGSSTNWITKTYTLLAEKNNYKIKYYIKCTYVQ